MKKTISWATLIALSLLFIMGVNQGDEIGGVMILISMGIAYSMRKNKEIINLLEKLSEGL